MNFVNDINKYKDFLAVITEDSKYIYYDELISVADLFKNEIKPRSLVFILCNNNLESIAGYLGLLRGKSVPALFSDSINQDFLSTLMYKYQPEYLWLPKEREPEIKDGSFVLTYGDYVLVRTAFKRDYEIDDELALLLTTSGSTGSPKLVQLSYKNIISNANSIAEYLDITQIDKPITSLPMSYTFGLSIINSHLLKGCTMVLTSKTLMDRDFWHLFKEHEVTSFSGVPYIYEMLKKLRFSRMNYPSLKSLTQAGGKLGKELSLEFANICREKSIKFYVMYGQTEATARMSYLPPEHSVEKAGSVGIAIPGGKFYLEDDNGIVINEPDVAGELIYQGDNVSMGYAEDFHDLCNGDHNKGILKTGDLAQFDKDGFFYIVGRKKRFLKLFGNRVNLDEVEQMLKGKGYDCACTGQDDMLKVFVTSSDDNKQIKKFISNVTGINQAGFKVERINEIPRNDVGKTLYSDLNKY